MARKGRRQQQVKGFRPGKEPLHLKKRRAKAELGKDASWAQKQAVEAVAGRSPKEVAASVRRWSIALGGSGVVIAVLGLFLYPQSVAAGVASHAVAAGLLFLAYRLRKQLPALVDMAESLR
jgi:hypothetical protein